MWSWGTESANVERALLRHGNVAIAAAWRTVLLPVIERYGGLGPRVVTQMALDAASGIGAIARTRVIAHQF